VGTGVNPLGSTIALQDDLSTTQAVVGVDYPDSYSWDKSAGSFSWKWGTGVTDGVVISPILVLGTSLATCFSPTVLSNPSANNLTEWRFHYYNTVTDSVAYMSAPLTSLPQICVYQCQNSCFLNADCADCAKNPACGWCQDNQQCLQATNTALDSCVAHYANNTCPCTLSSASCALCARTPGCGWCCAGSNQQSCVNTTSSCPSTITTVAANCSAPTACTPACARGECICGACLCPAGWGGADCNSRQGCDGVIGSGLVFDVCGVCGGNGTSCLGCNGVPFGPKNDSCGVCGGDGSECWNPCAYTKCNDCLLAAELCHWCATKTGGTCRAKTTACLKGEQNLAVCAAVIAVAGGLSAGAIAAIVIAVIALIVCLCLLLGGGTTAAVGLYSRAELVGAQTNPLYTDEGKTGNNPFYTENTLKDANVNPEVKV